MRTVGSKWKKSRFWLTTGTSLEQPGAVIWGSGNFVLKDARKWLKFKLLKLAFVRRKDVKLKQKKASWYSACDKGCQHKSYPRLLWPFRSTSQFNSSLAVNTLVTLSCKKILKCVVLPHSKPQISSQNTAPISGIQIKSYWGAVLLVLIGFIVFFCFCTIPFWLDLDVHILTMCFNKEVILTHLGLGFGICWTIQH